MLPSIKDKKWVLVKAKKLRASDTQQNSPQSSPDGSIKKLARPTKGDTTRQPVDNKKIQSEGEITTFPQDGHDVT